VKGCYITCGLGDEHRNSARCFFTRPARIWQPVSRTKLRIPGESVMLPTVTIESTRILSTFDMELLLAGIVVIAAIGWMMMSRFRHHR